MKKILVLLACLVALSGCQPVAKNVENENKKETKVITTIAPLYSLTSHLIENTDTQLENIVPANTSVHSFNLTPQTAKNIANADLVIINGLELETFLENVLDGKKVVDTSKGVKLKKNEEHKEKKDDHHGHDEHGHDEHKHESHDDDDHDDHEGHEHESHSNDHHDEHEEDHHGHAHGEFDPHIWLSPENAKIQAKNIANALTESDPQNADQYAQNLKALTEKLDELNKEGKARIKKITLKPYIVFHDAYHYFEENFGIEAEAYLEEFPGKEPTPQYLTQIIDTITDKKVTVIFSEPQFSPQLVKALAKDYGVKNAELDPLGASISKNAYFEMIEKNISSIEAAFND